MSFHHMIEPSPRGAEGSASAAAETEPEATITSSPAVSTSTTSGTAVSGNLQGRDPDLIFEGETIMVNGKEYLVQKGDTLSGIAVKLGLAREGNQQEILNAVVKLATENGMDLKKMDQDGFRGLEQPTATSPQPPNGGATAPVPANGANPGAPLNESEGTTNSGTSTPVNQASGQGNGLWSSLLAADPEMKKDDGSLKTKKEIDSGIGGGPIKKGGDPEEGRYENLLRRVNDERRNPKSKFTPAQLDGFEELIKRAYESPDGGATSLSAVEKYALNMFGREYNDYINKIVLDPDVQSPGSASLA
jgi:hypothetical protein